jgi:hypothetical protein
MSKYLTSRENLALNLTFEHMGEETSTREFAVCAPSRVRPLPSDGPPLSVLFSLESSLASGCVSNLRACRAPA